jgi:hypothetical protein
MSDPQVYQTTADPLDEDGYPTDETLERVRVWPYTDLVGLFTFLHSIWWHAGWCWHRQRGRKLWISTGGWSGNEDLFDALNANWIVSSQCYHSHRRGGHYIFEFPEGVTDIPDFVERKPTDEGGS